MLWGRRLHQSKILEQNAAIAIELRRGVSGSASREKKRVYNAVAWMPELAITYFINGLISGTIILT